MVPGSNILNLAFLAIAKTTVSYRRFTGRTENAQGQDVATYAAAVDVRGSWQPVPRRLIQQNGLDFNSNYATFYVSLAMIQIERGMSGDQVEFAGRIWQALDANPWGAVDGWMAVLFVDVGPVPPAPPPPEEEEEDE